jgi:hypothetical protein
MSGEGQGAAEAKHRPFISTGRLGSVQAAGLPEGQLMPGCAVEPSSHRALTTLGLQRTVVSEALPEHSSGYRGALCGPHFVTGPPTQTL